MQINKAGSIIYSNYSETHTVIRIDIILPRGKEHIFMDDQGMTKGYQNCYFILMGLLGVFCGNYKRRLTVFFRTISSSKAMQIVVKRQVTRQIDDISSLL